MNNIIAFIYPKTYINKIDSKIKSLGSFNKLTTSSFILSRLILECLIFLIFILIPIYGLLLSILFVILFHFLYEDILITSKLITRNKDMTKDAIMYFNILLLNINNYKSIEDLLLISSNIINNRFTNQLKVLLKGNNYNEALLELSSSIPEGILADYLKDMSICKSNQELEIIIHNLLNDLNENNLESLNKKIGLLPLKFSILVIIFLVIVLGLLIVLPKYM